ncbi:MAG: UDP-N-acetylmuramoyl-tripeptide--D-alanyl-D-alanine ligase [Kiritimatiellae bacterium]|nr:UDP-N-acetylmuramoyl-tripeptide--D-alanyl-D-alanine ligase [Kiritimatiellia bacterium]
MLACTIVAALLAAWASIPVMLHSMHMFQLNGYKFPEQCRWLRRNASRQWILGLGLLLGVFRLFFPHAALDAAICLVLLLEIPVYRAKERLASKKKLVFTPRVRRMFATIALLVALAVAATAVFAGPAPLAGLFAILASAQLVLNLPANLLNSPLEAAINRRYVNEAKRLLAASPRLKTIGVTGSYGKTSMKFFLRELLRDRFEVLATPGNFNTPLGVTRTVRGSLKPTHEIFICEMGARRVGEIREICEIAHPSVGIVTAIGPQHLETFRTVENILSTKFELADALPPGGMLFLNGDDPLIREKAASYLSKTFYFCETTGDGYQARDVAVSPFGTEFSVVAPDGATERFQMKLLGKHNVLNVVGAIAVAHSLGIPLKDLKAPVRRLRPVEHRMQLRDRGNVTIIDDAYNSNPAGARAAVETLAMMDGLRILVTPGMVELGEREFECNREFGARAAACCDFILLVGRKRAVPIRQGALEKGFPTEKCLVFDTLEEALARARAIPSTARKFILLENDLPDNY